MQFLTGFVFHQFSLLLLLFPCNCSFHQGPPDFKTPPFFFFVSAACAWFLGGIPIFVLILWGAADEMHFLTVGWKLIKYTYCSDSDWVRCLSHSYPALPTGVSGGTAMWQWMRCIPGSSNPALPTCVISGTLRWHWTLNFDYPALPTGVISGTLRWQWILSSNYPALPTGVISNTLRWQWILSSIYPVLSTGMSSGTVRWQWMRCTPGSSSPALPTCVINGTLRWQWVQQVWAAVLWGDSGWDVPLVPAVLRCQHVWSMVL